MFMLLICLMLSGRLFQSLAPLFLSVWSPPFCIVYSLFFVLVVIIFALGFKIRPRSHYSVFVSIRFRSIEATVHTEPSLYKNGEKNLRFCAFTLISLITKTQRKTSVFVCSHYSVFVKLIIGYWSVFKNLRFCAFTLIKCVFKDLRFCGYPLLTAFSKTSVFVAF